VRIVVFGGSGFIGTRLVPRLIALGHDVLITDIAPSQNYPRLFHHCDIRNARAVREACAGADVIYNLAAVHRDDVRPRSLYREVNVGGAANTCAAASANRIDRIVFTSSVAIYGFSADEVDEGAEPVPFNDYGKTKLEAEGVFKGWYGAQPGRTLTIVRPTVVFGEGNRGNVFTLIDQIRRRRFAMVGSGDNIKSIAYVENVAAFLQHVLSRPPGFDVYNYVDKPDYRTSDLVSTIRRQLGITGQPASIPYPLAVGIGAVCDVLTAVSGRTLPISRIRVQKFSAPSRFSSARAMASGFVAPVSLEEGLRRTIAEEG
jgi:nucleoside-diphosphate-sugar epimerase